MFDHHLRSFLPTDLGDLAAKVGVVPTRAIIALPILDAGFAAPARVVVEIFHHLLVFEQTAIFVIFVILRRHPDSRAPPSAA